jgi:hypothetical protein
MVSHRDRLHLCDFGPNGPTGPNPRSLTPDPLGGDVASSGGRFLIHQFKKASKQLVFFALDSCLIQ